MECPVTECTYIFNRDVPFFTSETFEVVVVFSLLFKIHYLILIVYILPFKLISIHASKSARLFHFYISRISSAIYRMIRWKKEKPKYPDKIFSQRMKKPLEKNYLH